MKSPSFDRGNYSKRLTIPLHNRIVDLLGLDLRNLDVGDADCYVRNTIDFVPFGDADDNFLKKQ
jgi:hypothetical protein